MLRSPSSSLSHHQRQRTSRLSVSMATPLATSGPPLASRGLPSSSSCSSSPPSSLLLGRRPSRRLRSSSPQVIFSVPDNAPLSVCPSAAVAGGDGVVLLGFDAGRCCGRAGEEPRIPALLRGRPPPRLLPAQDGGGELHRPTPSFLQLNLTRMC